jgi:hypothetical protein
MNYLIVYAHYFHPRLTFAVKAGAYPSVLHLGRLLAFLSNIRLDERAWSNEHLPSEWRIIRGSTRVRSSLLLPIETGWCDIEKHASLVNKSEKLQQKLLY